MDLQPRRETVLASNEFLLNTQGLIYKVGGITLDGAAFGDGVVKGGTAVMIGGAGLAVPYADAAGAFPAGAEVYLTAHDAEIKGGRNNVTGAVINAYVKASKVTGATTAFKAATASRIIYG